MSATVGHCAKHNESYTWHNYNVEMLKMSIKQYYQLPLSDPLNSSYLVLMKSCPAGQLRNIACPQHSKHPKIIYSENPTSQLDKDSHD